MRWHALAEDVSAGSQSVLVISVATRRQDSMAVIVTVVALRLACLGKSLLGLVTSFDLTLVTILELGHTICLKELYFYHSWLSGMGNEPRTLESIMLSWALTFLVLALIAALFGFGGIAAGAASIAKILFFLFLVLFVVSLIVNVTRGRNVV